MIKRLLHFKPIFLIWCIVYICLNVFLLWKKLSPEHPISFPGIKFSGLTEYLQDEKKISYITDLDTKETVPLAEYEQAQYIMAPVILDLSKQPHKFLVINCSSEMAALRKLKEWQAKPLLRNQFGVILATTEISPANTSAAAGPSP